MSDISDALERMATATEEGWRRSALANVRSEDNIGTSSLPFLSSGSNICVKFSASDAQRITEQVWGILKTLLFSTVMLQQAILDVLLHVASPLKPSSSLDKQPRRVYISAPDLSASVLRTLMCLSFVVEKFGGVSSAPDQQGFGELRKVFYLALDILSADSERSEVFLKDSCAGVNPNQSKSSYVRAPGR